MMMMVKDLRLHGPPEKLVRPIAAGNVLGMQLINGIIEAQSAVMLPQLTAEGSALTITKNQASWIASLGIVASPVSSVLCGPLMDLLGRKIVLQSYYVIAAIGFLIIANANEISLIYAGRFVLSIANGFGVGTVVYLPEICTKTQRSRLAALLMPLFTLGILTAFLIGGFLQWDAASLCYTIVSILGLLSVFYTPESPAWLVSKGKYDDARRNLGYLRNRSFNIDNEIESLKLTCEYMKQRKSRSLKDFFEPIVWKPFVILVLFHFLQTATGIYGLMYYTVDFFDDLGTAFDPLTVTIFLSVARLIMSCVFGTWCSTSIDRKLLTALSSCLSGASLLGAAFYEYIFKHTEADERILTWIPIGCILINVLVCTLTVQPLPWLMTKELFPLPVRGFMCGLTYFLGTFFVFLSVKYFVFFMSLLGISGALSFFSATSFIVSLFGVFILPETNKKTRFEIESIFTSSKQNLADVEKTPLLSSRGNHSG